MSERAQTLTDAVVAIIAESGFEALSVRTVAARAGMSIGAVQHHFPTKSQMLAAAMREVAGQ
jgi:AcrR family transcriptional regulator